MNLCISPVKFSASSSQSHTVNGRGAETSLETKGVSYGAMLFHKNAYELVTRNDCAGGNKIRAFASLAAGAPITGLGLPIIFATSGVLTAITLGIRIAVGLPLALGAGAIGGVLAFVFRGDVGYTADTFAQGAANLVALTVCVPAHLALYGVQLGVSAIEVVGYSAGWAVGAIVGLPWTIAG